MTLVKDDITESNESTLMNNGILNIESQSCICEDT